MGRSARCTQLQRAPPGRRSPAMRALVSPRWIHRGSVRLQEGRRRRMLRRGTRRSTSTRWRPRAPCVQPRMGRARLVCAATWRWMVGRLPRRLVLLRRARSVRTRGQESNVAVRGRLRAARAPLGTQARQRGRRRRVGLPPSRSAQASPRRRATRARQVVGDSDVLPRCAHRDGAFGVPRASCNAALMPRSVSRYSFRPPRSSVTMRENVAMPRRSSMSMPSVMGDSTCFSSVASARRSGAFSRPCRMRLPARSSLRRRACTRRRWPS